MCPTLVPTGALVCLRTLAPLGHIPVFRVYLVMGGGAVRGHPRGPLPLALGYLGPSDLETPVGTGFCKGHHTAIQGEGRQGGAGAPACGVGVCVVPLSLGWDLCYLRRQLLEWQCSRRLP